MKKIVQFRHFFYFKRIFYIPEKNIPVEHAGPNVNPQYPQSDQESTSRLCVFFLNIITNILCHFHCPIVVICLFVVVFVLFCFIFGTFSIVGVHRLLYFCCPFANFQSSSHIILKALLKHKYSENAAILKKLPLAIHKQSEYSFFIYNFHMFRIWPFTK